MRTLSATMITALVLMAGSANAAPPCPDENLGSLTSWAIHNLPGWDQGQHSADPSGDGHGPGTVDEPRVGLANIIELGNLKATLALLVDLLSPGCD